MKTEIEVKFPDIDKGALRKKLKKVGATLQHSEILMRRKILDHADHRLEKIGGWIRVRDEGDVVTFAYKQLNDRTLHGTKEVSVTVSDFEKTCEILNLSGLTTFSFQESKREKWLYKKSEITIDTWPWVPSFVEIEGPTEKEVRAIAKELGFDWNSAMHGSVETVYQMHYDFTEKEIGNWKEIKFTPEPKWLLAKKKK